MANNPFGGQLYPPTPRSMLTVRDVERLAVAGVKIDFEQIAYQVIPDPPPEAPQDQNPRFYKDDLTDAFWDRYNRNMKARHTMSGQNYDGMLFKWAIKATDGKDKINVYVAPTDGSEPFILQDEKCLFPSDALFAALDLHEATRGKT